jgi:DNA polymerase elongation subunit (family B)
MRDTKSSAQFLKNFIESIDTKKNTNELYDKFKKNNIDVKKTAQQKKSFSFSVHYGGVRLDYGVGGIHGCVSPGVYSSSDLYDILDIDVKSYYPNLFIQNRLHPKQMDQDTFVRVYSDIFQQRVQAQKEDDQLTADALKLSLNGLFGKTGSDVSCFYDPHVFYAVTVNGQLLISMLLEKLYSNGCQILQVNTDGVTIFHDKNIRGKVEQICKEWEAITKLTLEYANYSKMIIRDVNNYIAVRTDGKIKEKGAFETKKDWHKDNSYMVVPLAVREYLVNNVPVEKTLSEHKNILDFCGRYKASPNWHVEYAYLDGLREKRLNFGKIYRYIPVHKGGTSLKLNKDGREHHLCEGSMTVPFNQIIDFDWNNINFPFFVNECQKLIQTIQPLQMTLL